MSTNQVNECDEFFSTADVAVDTDSSEAEARGWAAENGVQRVGNAFVWTTEDVEDYAADLDEDEEIDDDEDQEDDDSEDDDSEDDDSEDDDSEDDDPEDEED